jgi:hypothetical protein
VAHINQQHLSSTVIRCERCELHFNSEEAFKVHTKIHKNQLKQDQSEKSTLSTFNIFDEYEYIPPNILSLPILPLIESARSAKAFEYKLPLSVKLYELLTTFPDSERK